MQREKNTLSCQLDQEMKRVKQLEEEKQNIEQNLTKSRTMVDDLKSMFWKCNKSHWYIFNIT